MTQPTIDAPKQPDIFLAVFEQIFFPYLAADMGSLSVALKKDPNSKSHLAIPIQASEPSRRAALVASMRGLLRGLDVPEPVFELFRKSPAIEHLGLGDALLEMAAEPGTFSIAELGDQLVWEEETLWPIAYATLFQQLVGILQMHTKAVEQSMASNPTITTLSEYPRQMSTHLHYAVASLVAWLAGATNVQYFSFYATQPQIREPAINKSYAERIGYSPEVATKLDQSGIISLPASLMLPLFQAQGDGTIFGSLPIDETNVANMPREEFFASRRGDETTLAGFLMDKYYRAPFLARHLKDYGLYGSHDVLRDHYEEFYKGIPTETLVRCKHYCAPVVEVSSIEEIFELITKIPLRDKEGLFFRGQTRLYKLNRSPEIRRFLFAESCGVEPSLVTSAIRHKGYDYDSVHFALKHFLEGIVLTLEGIVLTRSSNPDAGEPLAWQAKSASPVCQLDYALMALAQHYGLASHGLDVTRSQDVAVWFATNRFVKTAQGVAGYEELEADDWSEDPDDWPVMFIHQCVTHSIRQSLHDLYDLHDCHELEEFGFEARRATQQKARFFLGGHSEHQNRLAETLVCVLRLRPARYATQATFESLFPSPAEDPAYRIMLDFAEVPEFEALGVGMVNRFHA